MQRSHLSPSPEEITRRFYGAHLSPVDAPFRSPKVELTATAKYVVRETKKLIDQSDLEYPREQPEEAELLRLIQHVERLQGENLSERERTAVVAVLNASFEHYDILTPLIENPEINDIIVRSFDDISVQRNRENVQTGLRFADQDTYRAFVENLLKRASKSCTSATPVVDAAIDPSIRACVTHESFSPPGSGPMLTLRIARHRAISLESLAHKELAPQAILDYLASVVACGDATVLIAGEVGTGKTTLVRALTWSIPEPEAVLIIEDTHELALERKFVRTLLTREPNTEGAGKIPPALAIRTGMRMAMNRLILGEMRDSEAAEAFIDVCSSGHAGMSTIHAKSAKDALSRLELFLARAQPGVGADTLRRQIANAVSVVVYLGLDKLRRQRRIVEVTEVGSFIDGAIQLSPIFRYHPHEAHPAWRRESGVSAFTEPMLRNGSMLPHSGSLIGFDAADLYRSYPS
ncbi:MAG: ATPase, T2SS/T4P/T4SS family [Bdellovibrionota bacterium]